MAKLTTAVALVWRCQSESSPVGTIDGRSVIQTGKHKTFPRYVMLQCSSDINGVSGRIMLLRSQVRL